MTYYGISGAARAAGNKAAGRVSAQSVRRAPAKITPVVPSTARVNGRTAIKSTSVTTVPKAGGQVKRNTAAVRGVISADTAARRTAQGNAQSAHKAMGTRASTTVGTRARVLTKTRTRVKYIDTAVKATPMPVHVICGAVMITLLFLFFVYNCVQLNEYNAQTVQLKKQINGYTQEYVSLEKQLEEREDIASIEQKAISIGMIKKDLLPRKYVSVIDGDKIEVIKDSSEQGGISTLLSGISRSIINIQEYLKG